MPERRKQQRTIEKDERQVIGLTSGGHGVAAHGGGHGGHAKKADKDNKDPWAEGNFEKTIEDRVQENQDVASAVEAIDADFERRIKELIQDRKGKVSDRFLDENSKEYDSKLAEDVQKLIDSHYNVNNRFSPLNKIVRKEGLGDSPMVKRILEDIYTSHKKDLYEGLGEKGFFRYFTVQKGENMKKVRNRHLTAAVGDIRPTAHGHLVDYLVDMYRIDKDKISPDRMKQDLKDLMTGHLAAEEGIGQFPKDEVTRKYRAYKSHDDHGSHAGGHGGGHGGGGSHH